MRTFSIFSTLFVATLATTAAAQIVYVDRDATGAGDGTSWTNAYPSLRTALDLAAPGDELWVAEGVYTPGPTAAIADTFQLKSGVALYGGFAGTEIARSERDWAAHPTVLSGDVGQDDVYGPYAWYIGWNIVTANSAQVVTGSGTDASAVLDGFTVEAGGTGPSGTPAGSWEMYAGGMMLINGSPTVTHCTFRRNIAAFGHGGAIYAQDSSPTLTHCKFVENYVHLGDGAGIYLAGASAPVIADCEFVANQCVGGTGGGQGFGSGISRWATPPMTVERCKFDLNEARGFYASGADLCRGGGIANFYDGLVVRDCTFTRNRAHAGSGIYTFGTLDVVNTVFANNVALSYALGSSSGGGFGAAVCSSSAQADVTTITNCVVYGNQGGDDVGVYTFWSHQTLVRNSILWGNVATGEQVPPVRAQFSGNTDVDHCCVQHLLDPIPGEDDPEPSNYPDCFDLEPQFANATAGDFHLLESSPCEDTGSDALVPAGTSTDLDGAARIQGGRVDLGVYERAPLAQTEVYCTAKESSRGCTPFIASAGTPSASAASGFVVSGLNVLGQTSGLLFYGTSGRSNSPFHGGTMCVAAPIRRCPIQNSGGSATSIGCTGAFAIDINDYAHNLSADPALTTQGTTVRCQWWGRDSGFAPANNIALTNALEYIVGP